VVLWIDTAEGDLRGDVIATDYQTIGVGGDLLHILTWTRAETAELLENFSDNASPEGVELCGRADPALILLAPPGQSLRAPGGGIIGTAQPSSGGGTVDLMRSLNHWQKITSDRSRPFSAAADTVGVP
jgi:hypothetical protein